MQAHHCICRGMLENSDVSRRNRFGIRTCQISPPQYHQGFQQLYSCFAYASFAVLNPSMGETGHVLDVLQQTTQLKEEPTLLTRFVPTPSYGPQAKPCNTVARDAAQPSSVANASLNLHWQKHTLRKQGGRDFYLASTCPWPCTLQEAVIPDTSR